MFAVVEIAGQQFKVEKGTKIDVQKLEEQEGGNVTFKTVMLIADGGSVKIGEPYVAGSSVSAKVLEQFKDEKVRVFKKRPKTIHPKQRSQTESHKLEVTSITG